MTSQQTWRRPLVFPRPPRPCWTQATPTEPGPRPADPGHAHRTQAKPPALFLPLPWSRGVPVVLLRLHSGLLLGKLSHCWSWVWLLPSFGFQLKFRLPRGPSVPRPLGSSWVSPHEAPCSGRHSTVVRLCSSHSFLFLVPLSLQTPMPSEPFSLGSPSPWHGV